MIKELQDLFKRSWDAFRTELDRREPEDQVAELLSGMKRELVAVRAMLPQLAESAAVTGRELERERQALADCERRGSLAERIGDEETRRVAAEFAERHRERASVLDRKLEATRAEHELRRREAEQMMQAYKRAESQRFALLARLRTERARSRLQGSEGELWDELGRMGEDVEDAGRYADALGDLGEDAVPPPPRDVDARLEELKRRMGK
jgi:phage shock protein A